MVPQSAIYKGVNYGSNGNVPKNNFKNHGDGGNAAIDEFMNYKEKLNVGDDSFQLYVKNSNSGTVKFKSYGQLLNEGTDKFNGYGKGGSGQEIGFETYGVNNTFTNYDKKKGVLFARYLNESFARSSMASSAKFINRWVELGKFFRCVE
ncbi:polygalacturonase 1 beta-like protein 3 [Camellia sinensis]|uniref:polygalacturonase 1 beta-like protein 3 n=1 Tax=Camellia sinensis TaxID=4442 RepID=UPI00103673B6|nr:polygalacturonase 1 beta-like protein 3 [Camellia sinensis]